MIPIRRIASLLLPLRLPAAVGCALAFAGSADRASDAPAVAPSLWTSSRPLPAAGGLLLDLSVGLLPAAETPIDWSATPAFAVPDAVVLAALMSAPHVAADALLATPGHDVCEQVAFIARMGALEEARADFQFGLAKCVNAGGRFAGCMRDLNAEYRAAVQLVWEQYHGRLEACDLLGSGAYRPEVDPRAFSHVVDNVFWPLVPGRTLVYRKATREGVEVTRVTTLRETRMVAGVRCAVVRDVVTIDDELIEDTDDWFAQHRSGDVWYMGELARNYEDGMLADLDGSWQTGKEGALPGIQMLRAPRVGAAYRQEFLLNEAEDIAEVVARGVTVTVPAGTYRNCLQTEETTPLEPDAEEQKYYAAGIGLVLAVNGEGERTELVEIIDR